MTGAIAPKGDAEALARALLDALGDREQAAALGAEGRRLAQEELSIDRMVGSLVGLYEETAR